MQPVEETPTEATTEETAPAVEATEAPAEVAPEQESAGGTAQSDVQEDSPEAE